MCTLVCPTSCCPSGAHAWLVSGLSVLLFAKFLTSGKSVSYGHFDFDCLTCLARNHQAHRTLPSMHACLPETMCRRKTHRVGTTLPAAPGARTSFVFVRAIHRMPTLIARLNRRVAIKLTARDYLASSPSRLTALACPIF